MADDETIDFIIDGKHFNKPTSGEDIAANDDGHHPEDALPSPKTLEVTERYEIVRQPCCGFKTITQVTEPVALKVLHFVVETFTKDDRDFMDGLDNYAPHEVTCADLCTTAPIKMWVENKIRRKPRTGVTVYNIEWDITMCEVNDNNNV